MMDPEHEIITGRRFADWKQVLYDKQAVPMLCVGCGIGEGHPLRGQIIAMNSQDKSDEEVIVFLRELADALEAQLQ